MMKTLILISLSIVLLVESAPEPDVSHILELPSYYTAEEPAPSSRQQVAPHYSTFGLTGYPKIIPPPLTPTAAPRIIGNCSCPAGPTCEPVVVYRNVPKLVKVPGERRTVYLNQERLKEVPQREVVYVDKEFMDIQRNERTVPQPVELTREILREEYEYYDVIVDRIEIQYNDVTERVILEEEETQIDEQTVDQPIQVQLREQTCNFVDQPEKVWLRFEQAEQYNETMKVKMTLYDIRPVENVQQQTLDCDNYRIVMVPRDDCHKAKTVNGYLPPPS